MKHIYSVTGMTCNNCKSKVESLINSIDAVEAVSVDLENAIVTINSNQAVSLELLQSVLPEKYGISSAQNIAFKKEEKSELKQLFPLFLILGYIVIASVLLNKTSWHWNSFMLDFMGLFYIVFSFFKLLDLKGFPESFRMYDPLAKAIPVYGYIYPFIEVSLGLMFLMRFQIPLALLLTLIILGVTTIGVVKILLDKKTIQCACLGTALKLPMTKATFIENSIMIIMALIMLINTYK